MERLPAVDDDRLPGDEARARAGEVDDCADDLRTWKQAYLSKALKDDTAQVRIEAEVELRHLGLLRNWTPWIVAAAPSAIYLLLSFAAFSWLVRYR